MIYFIRNTGTGNVKIGYSADPIARLRTLQTAHCDRLEIVATMAGDMGMEARFHAMFAADRLNGEWFSGDPVMELIASLTKPGARPLAAVEPPMIYMAGGISKSRWRERIFDGLAEYWDGSTSWYEVADPYITKHGFVYAGPWYVTEPSKAIAAELGRYIPDGSDEFREVEMLPHRAGVEDKLSGHSGIVVGDSIGGVPDKCLEWIDISDVVFAWVDRDASFGTFCEIGYAKAKSKRIFVASPSVDLAEEAWFVHEIACRSVAYDKLKVEDAWSLFVTWFYATHRWPEPTISQAPKLSLPSPSFASNGHN